MEQALMAILLALRHFEVYLPSHCPVINIYSDHHSSRFRSKIKFKNQQLMRCSFLLQEYKLNTKYVKGKDKCHRWLSVACSVLGVTRTRIFCSEEQNFPTGVGVLQWHHFHSSILQREVGREEKKVDYRVRRQLGKRVRGMTAISGGGKICQSPVTPLRLSCSVVTVTLFC